MGKVEEVRGGLADWPSPRFPSPVIKPDVRISRIRLSDWLHCEAHGGIPAPEPRVPQRSCRWRIVAFRGWRACVASRGSVLRVRRRGDQFAARSITEVGRPAAEEAVEPVLDYRPWLDVAGRQNSVDVRLDPFNTFRRWICAETSGRRSVRSRDSSRSIPTLANSEWGMRFCFLCKTRIRALGGEPSLANASSIGCSQWNNRPGRIRLQSAIATRSACPVAKINNPQSKKSSRRRCGNMTAINEIDNL